MASIFRGSDNFSTENAYTRTNAVGAVGQVGGVPTGAVIESGVNANGRYTKFADGTLICTAGGSFETGDTQTWTFPTFREQGLGAPNVSGIVWAGGADRYLVMESFTPTSVTFRKSTSGAEILGFYVTFVGRWY